MDDYVIVENTGKKPVPVMGQHLFHGERRRVPRRVFDQISNMNIVEVESTDQADPAEDDSKKDEGDDFVTKPLKGKTFVVAGNLPGMTHQEATRLIEKYGGQVIDKVDITLDYLVAGANPGERLQHAKGLSVEILDEAGLLKLIKPNES